MSASVELADARRHGQHRPSAGHRHRLGHRRGARERPRERGHHVHVATPDEVAEVIDFLASDAAELVSGSIIMLR